MQGSDGCDGIFFRIDAAPTDELSHPVCDVGTFANQEFEIALGECLELLGGVENDGADGLFLHDERHTHDGADLLLHDGHRRAETFVGRGVGHY